MMGAKEKRMSSYITQNGEQSKGTQEEGKPRKVRVNCKSKFHLVKVNSTL